MYLQILRHYIATRDLYQRIFVDYNELDPALFFRLGDLLEDRVHLRLGRRAWRDKGDWSPPRCCLRR